MYDYYLRQFLEYPLIVVKNNLYYHYNHHYQMLDLIFHQNFHLGLHQIRLHIHYMHSSLKH